MMFHKNHFFFLTCMLFGQLAESAREQQVRCMKISFKPRGLADYEMNRSQRYNGVPPEHLESLAQMNQYILPKPKCYFQVHENADNSLTIWDFGEQYLLLPEHDNDTEQGSNSTEDDFYGEVELPPGFSFPYGDSLMIFNEKTRTLSWKDCEWDSSGIPTSNEVAPLRNMVFKPEACSIIMKSEDELNAHFKSDWREARNTLILQYVLNKPKTPQEPTMTAIAQDEGTSTPQPKRTARAHRIPERNRGDICWVLHDGKVLKARVVNELPSCPERKCYQVNFEEMHPVFGRCGIQFTNAGDFMFKDEKPDPSEF